MEKKCLRFFLAFTWHLGPIYYFIYLDVMAVNTQLCGGSDVGF